MQLTTDIGRKTEMETPRPTQHTPWMLVERTRTDHPPSANVIQLEREQRTAATLIV